jgi:Fuc2NAc and GlcNAc transferase
MTAGQLLVLVAAVIGSWKLTELARSYALRHAIFDVPNERSMHTTPTPRGGGVVIAAVVVTGLLISCAAGWLPGRTTIAMVGGGALIAGIGWVDDRRGIAAGHRAAFHTIAAVWATSWLGGLHSLTVGRATIEMGVIGYAIAVLAIVWSINLYNFMDGIDGLAATEGVTVGGLAAVCLVMVHLTGIAFAAALAAAAAAGFLRWNWSPAKVFMGDTGSGFLGFMFAALAVAAERARPGSAVIVLVLLAVFWVDATLTLTRRLLRGERWYDAHRMHAYQRAVQAGWRHSQVSASVLAFNGLLGVFAFVMAKRPELAWVALAATLTSAGSLYLYVERLHPM